MEPFTLPLDKSNVMIQKEVDANILAVIDNLEDFYSTVAKDENPRKLSFRT